MSLVDTETGEVIETDEPLDELEAVIEKGLESFLDVGSALLKIKAGKRYREAGYSTFEDYCQKRWNISKGYGYRLTIAAATVEALNRDLPEGDGEEKVPMGTTLPTSERQVRPLNQLDSDDDKREAWSEAVETAESEGRAPSVSDVEQAVTKRTERRTESTTTETPEPEPEPTAGNEAVKRATENVKTTDTAYREAFSSALVKANRLFRLDPERCASVSLPGDRVADEQFVASARAWLDTFDECLHETKLRSVQ